MIQVTSSIIIHSVRSNDMVPIDHIIILVGNGMPCSNDFGKLVADTLD